MDWLIGLGVGKSMVENLMRKTSKKIYVERKI